MKSPLYTLLTTWVKQKNAFAKISCIANGCDGKIHFTFLGMLLKFLLPLGFINSIFLFGQMNSIQIIMVLVRNISAPYIFPSKWDSSNRHINFERPCPWTFHILPSHFRIGTQRILTHNLNSTTWNGLTNEFSFALGFLEITRFCFTSAQQINTPTTEIWNNIIFLLILLET